MADVDPQKAYIKNLSLRGVAGTQTPSNTEAKVFFTRNQEPAMAENAEAINIERAALLERVAKLEAANAAKDADNAKLLEVQRTQGAELERRAIAEERSSCADIARSVAPKLKAKDVDTADLLYRVRRAAKAIGDEKLEVDFLALLRVGNAATEAASSLTRSAGFSSGDGENPELPAEIARHVAPFMVEAKNNVVRAVALAAADAVKRGDNDAYSLLSSYKVN